MASTFASGTHRSTAAHRSASSARAARARRLSPVEVFTLILIAALLLVGLFASRQRAEYSGATQSLQIEAGDTLWSIAETHPVEGLTTAQVVDTIASVNHLDGDVVAPGQTIEVPSLELNDRLAMR